MSPIRKIKTLFFRLNQQQHRCFYCGVDMTAEDVQITTDHVQPQNLSWITPRAFDTPENTVAACIQCNADKGGSYPDDDTLARLAALNDGYSEAAADSYYKQMLRLSAEAVKVFDYYRQV